LRDYLTNEIGEILIDNEATYKEASEFVEQVMPHNLRKLKLYSDPVPLFTRFQIESQIESAFAHNVTLPSGGSIVIDHTEALVSIDINSARATKGSDIEATALNTNLEAADEIARQLRIRDLGGLIVIDFIDMGPQKNQRAVENRLREAVRQDRARVQIGKITRFGLLEMSRQRLRPSLGESSYHTCPRCSGFGTIRSVESLALAILRIVGEEARKERTTKVIAQLPVEVATYLLNEKRDWVRSVETRHDTQVVLVANSALETPHYDIRRVRDDQADLPENAGVSYSLAEAEPEPDVPASMQERQVAEQTAIGKIEPASPAPARKSVSGPGFWARLMSLFTGDKKKPAKKKSTKARRRKSSSGGERKKPQRGRRSDARKDDTRRPRKKQSKKKTTGK
jgi:ribonuclease E